MNENIKIAASCWIRYMLCALFAFFIYLSISVLTVGAYTRNIGYEARNPEGELLYTYYYEDGEDEKAEQYKEQGIEITKIDVRTQLSGLPKFFTILVAQLLSGAVTVAFIYKKLWNTGDNDANLVNYGHKDYNRLRGLYIGLIAVIPHFISWIMLVLSKAGALTHNTVVVFRFFNYQVFSISEWLLGTGTTSVAQIGWINIIASVLVCVLLPLVAFVAYILGYKRFSLKEKIVYKKER